MWNATGPGLYPFILRIVRVIHSLIAESVEGCASSWCGNLDRADLLEVFGINVGRVIGGGLLAGVVIDVVDGLTNGAVLGARWAEETKRLGIDMSGGAQSQSLAGWMTFGILCGIVLVWLYASIRPRYGPGPKTAVTAADGG